MPSSSNRLGIDLGGTKIEAAVLTPEGEVVFRRRVANPGDYDAAIDAFVTLVEAAESAVGHRFERVGVGMPGSLSPATGRVRNSNSVWLNDKPLYADLEERLGRSLRLANDANCMTLSEATDGAGARARSVFGVILGTGCGGGLAVDGKLIEGVNGVAGEWGHIPLPWPTADELPGTRCWCGRTNCLETYLSGSGLERDHEQRTGQPLEGPAIIAAARAGDAPARETLARHQNRLARALAVVVDLIDPEVVVFAGGLSNAPEVLNGLGEAMRPWVFSDVLTTRLVTAAHGDSSGVRGAAWLWPLA